jgi:hypothetical protein
MNILEKEIIEKFRQLKTDAQRRLLRTLADDVQSSFDWDAWWKEIESVQFTPSLEQAPSASDLINEAREERDADILRSIGRRDSAGDSSS